MACAVKATKPEPADRPHLARSGQHKIADAQILYGRIARRRSDHGSPAVANEIRLQRGTATPLQVLVPKWVTFFDRYFDVVIYRHFDCSHGDCSTMGKMV